MSSTIEERIHARVDSLPSGLRQHTLTVQRLAVDLARHHGVDESKASLAALAHDVARAMKGEDLLRSARELGITVHPVEERLPILLHGPVGAEMLRDADGLDDQDIYEAVRWHTTAHADLGAPGKVVFLADKLDPQKASRYPFLPEIKGLAERSLDIAILEFWNRELLSLLHQGALVHHDSLEARNDLLLKLI